MPKVSVIVPTLNEAGNIDPLLKRIFAVRDAHAIDLEVVFVDDASTDGTCEEIFPWQVNHPVVLVRRERDDGLAGAVIAGAKAAAGEFALVMDADLSHPPEAIPELLAPLFADSHDMVIGSRYVEGGATPEWPLSRKISSKLATLPARFFTDAKDPMAGLFAVRRHRLASLERQVCGFKIGLELLATADVDLRVTEIPIVFHDRYKGTSKMNAAVVGDYLRQLLLFVGARFLPAPGEGPWIALALLLGVAVDAVLVHFLMGLGKPLATAHVLSYLVASAAVFAGLATVPVFRGAPEFRLTLMRAAGFWCVMLLAMLLRGGVIGMLMRYAGWDALPAAAAAVVFGGLAAYLGNMVFIFTREEARINAELKWRYIGLAVVSVLLLCRLVFAGLPELLEEEAYYWNYARHMDIGFLDHPPMVAALIWIGTAIFGNSEFGVRAMAFVTWLVGAWFVNRYACRSLDRTIAFRALILYSILPFFFWTGLVLTPDAPLVACWAAVVYHLHRALVGGAARNWLWAGLWLGLGMLSKYTIALLGPATLVFMLSDRQARSWLLRPQPYLAALLALLVFSPVIAWNMENDWASFAYQSQGRVNDVAMFTTHRLVGAVLLLITPAGAIALCHFLLRGQAVLGRFFKEDHRDAARERRFILCMVLVPLSVFFFFSLFKEVKLNWTGPLWLALLPYMALTMRDLGRRAAADGFVRAMRLLWPATAGAVMLVSVAGLHYFSLGLPGVPNIHGPFMMGWRELAAEVDAAVERATEKTGSRPVVVGMDPYPIASALAFYRRGPVDRAVAETTAWHVFGWKGLMYAYWFPPETLEGRDMLVVATRRDPMRNDYFRRYVEKTYHYREIPVSRNGRPLAVYYYRLVRGYHHLPDPL
jgi:dolichol-phosphate mannosyltransferase